jgi:hypothetical protein
MKLSHIAYSLIFGVALFGGLVSLGVPTWLAAGCAYGLAFIGLGPEA